MALREGYRWDPSRWRPSEQQERVLDALAAGKTNPEIAADLGITVDGVKWHVRELLTKTGLGDRHDLARWWRERNVPFMRLVSLRRETTLPLSPRDQPVASVTDASSWI